LLIAPATATYHFLVLSIPVAMLSPVLMDRKQFHLLGIVVLLYVGIGIVPAGAFDRIGLEGGWKLLAYPRLYLLLALFLTMAGMMGSAGRSEISSSTSV
jgi:hypothetical protein